MKGFKKFLWGVCFIIFIIGLVSFFKYGINYSKNVDEIENNSSLKHSISSKVDKIVSSIKLEEQKEDDGLYMVGIFENTTGYDLSKVTILYEIVNKHNEIIREDKIVLENIAKDTTKEIKISVSGIFDYTIRMTSDYNVGL